MAIMAWRSAATVSTEERGPYRVTLSPAEADEPSRYAVDLSFQIPAGKGFSDLCVTIGSKEFAQVAQAMMDVDPEEAVKAFGAAMVAGCRARDEVAFFASFGDDAPPSNHAKDT